jgi:putative transposase
MTADLVTNTMISALKNNPKPQEIYSDMESQYTSDQFEMVLKRFKINHSYLLKGHPYDNTYIENFHSMLKREYISSKA